MNSFRPLRNFAIVLVPVLLLAMNSGDAHGAAAATSAAPTTQPPQIKWQKLADETELAEMEMFGQPKPIPAAKISFGPGGGTVRVLELENPGVTAASWMIQGKVRYANVVDDGYLEMWSHFPDGTAYFSRTLDKSGPLGVLHGKSEWRDFRLPFYSEPGKTPSKLEVNVVLPSGGVVWLGPAKLKDGLPALPPAPAAPPAPPAKNKAAGKTAAALPWWGDSQGGRIGGALGTILGFYGALLGIAASRLRSRRFVTSIMIAGMSLCTLLLIAGLIAWGGGQPYAVWYPLLLGGGIGGIVSGSLLPVIRRRFDEAEMRRMMALDA